MRIRELIEHLQVLDPEMLVARHDHLDCQEPIGVVVVEECSIWENKPPLINGIPIAVLY